MWHLYMAGNRARAGRPSAAVGPEQTARPVLPLISKERDSQLIRIVGLITTRGEDGQWWNGEDVGESSTLNIEARLNNPPTITRA